MKTKNEFNEWLDKLLESEAAPMWAHGVDINQDYRSGIALGAESVYEFVMFKKLANQVDFTNDFNKQSRMIRLMKEALEGYASVPGKARQKAIETLKIIKQMEEE